MSVAGEGWIFLERTRRKIGSSLSGPPGAALVEEIVSGRTGQARMLQGFDAKAGVGHKIVHLAIEMAATCQARPQWIEPILPTCNPGFGRAAMFDE